MNINEFRQKYPDYSDLTDAQLAEGLYNTHYSDLDRGAFYSTFGVPLPEAPPEPEEEKGIIGEAYDAASNLFKGIGSSFATMPVSAVKGTGVVFGAPIEGEFVSDLSQTERDIQEWFGGDTNTMSYKLGSAIGSMGAFVATSLAGALLAPAAAVPAVGAAALTWGARLIPLAAKYGAPALMGAGAGAAEQVDRLRYLGDKLGDVDKIDQRLSILSGYAVGTSEITSLRWTVGLLLKAIKKDAPDWMVNRWVQTLAAAGAEGAQEAGAQIAQNAIAKGFYDPNISLTESAAENFGYGASAAGILHGALALMLPKGGKGPGTEISPTEEADAAAVAAAEAEAAAAEQPILAITDQSAPVLLLEDLRPESEKTAAPEEDGVAVAEKIVGDLGGDLVLSFNNGVITTDATGTPDAYEVQQDGRGRLFVQSKTGIRVSPYLSTRQQAETVRSELNFRIPEILERQDRMETEALAQESVRTAKEEERPALLVAARAAITSPLIAFDELSDNEAIRINKRRIDTGETPYPIDALLSVKELSDQGLGSERIGQLLPATPRTFDKAERAGLLSRLQEKGFRTKGDGFDRFARRKTGTANVKMMGDAQLAMLETAIEELPSLPAGELRSLPVIQELEFNGQQYATAINTARLMPARFDNTDGTPRKNPLEEGEILKSDINKSLGIRGGLTESILREGVKRGDLVPSARVKGAYIATDKYRRPFGERARRPEERAPEYTIARQVEGGPKGPLRGRVREEDIEGLAPIERGELIEQEARDAAAAEPTAPFVGEGIKIRRAQTDGTPASLAEASAAFKAKIDQATVRSDVRAERFGGVSKFQEFLAKRLKGVKGLKDRNEVALELVRTLDGGAGQDLGVFNANKMLIALSLDAIDPKATRDEVMRDLVELLDHETIHALRVAGVFSDADWKILTNFVKKAGTVKEKRGRPIGLDETYYEEAVRLYAERPAYKALSPKMKEDKLVEEAIANAFADFGRTKRAYINGKLKTISGAPLTLFRRIVDFFRSLRGAFSALDIQNVGQVFVGLREEQTGPAAPAPGVTAEQQARADALARERGQAVADAPPDLYAVRRAYTRDEQIDAMRRSELEEGGPELVAASDRVRELGQEEKALKAESVRLRGEASDAGNRGDMEEFNRLSDEADAIRDRLKSGGQLESEFWEATKARDRAREAARRRPPADLFAVRRSGRDVTLPMDEAARMARADALYPVDALHGSPRDIMAFSNKYSTPDGYYGGHHYFTTGIDDANENYASLGPDLSNRIEREADQLSSEDVFDELVSAHWRKRGLKFKAVDDLSKDQVEAATQEIVQQNLGIENLGTVYPVRLRMENPVRVGGRGIVDDYSDVEETFFDYTSEYDEQGDFVGEEGAAIDLLESTRETFVEWDVSAKESDRAFEKIYESMSDNEGISASDFERAIRDNVFDAYDPEGNPASPGALIAEIYQKMGFDSIDMDAAIFSIRARARATEIVGMPGTEDARHYIIFNPSNIRSRWAAFDPEKMDKPGLSYAVRRRPRDPINTARSPLNDDATVADRALSKRARALSVLDVLYNEELPPETGALIGEVGKRLQRRGLRVLKSPVDIVADQSRDDLISDALAAETLRALQESGNAANWYTVKVAQALEVAAEIHPEIATDIDNRFLFLVSMAVTSQQQPVLQNARSAEEVYRDYQRDGRFPDKGWGEAAQSMKKNFDILNGLIETHEIAGTRDIFDRLFTVRELRKAGFPASTAENAGTVVNGSYILGAKIGQGFYQNLIGNYDPLTIDMWLMRTMGRMTGRLIGNPALLAKQTNRLLEGLRAVGNNYDTSLLVGLMTAENVNEVAIVTLADDLRLRHERAFKEAKRLKQEYVKPEWAKAATAIVVQQTKPKDSPSSGGFREATRRIANKVLDKVKASGYPDMTIADLQATLWYPEKNLWEKLGAAGGERLNMDYAQAFERILDDLRNERVLARDRGAGRPAGDVEGRDTALRAEPQETYGEPGAAAPEDLYAVRRGGRLGPPVESRAARERKQLDRARAEAPTFEEAKRIREARRRGDIQTGDYSQRLQAGAINPIFHSSTPLTWEGKNHRVIIQRGHNEWNDLKQGYNGFGLRHANEHLTDIQANTPFDSVQGFVDGMLSAYRNSRNTPEAANFELRESGSELVLRWDNPSPNWPYPGTLVFREASFNRFESLIEAYPNLIDQTFFSLKTAFALPVEEGAVKPKVMPLINPAASVRAKRAAAAAKPNERVSPLLREQFSVRRSRDNYETREQQSFHDRHFDSGSEETFFEKIMRGLGLNSEEHIGSMFRYQTVDKFEGWAATEKLTVKGGFRDEPLTAESSTTAAFTMFTRATGIMSATLTEGPVIYTRGFFQAVHPGMLKSISPEIEELHRRDYNQLGEDTAYTDPVTAEEVRYDRIGEEGKWGPPQGLVQAWQTVDNTGHMEQVFHYGAAVRAVRFKKEGRPEKTFSDEDIRIGLQIGEQFPEVRLAHQKYQLWNNAIVNLMVKTGVISEQMGELWKANGDYLPFYREFYADEGVNYQVMSPDGTPTRDTLFESLDTNNNKFFPSFQNLKQPKELKGGKPVYRLMVGDVADTKAYTDRKSPQLQARLDELIKLNRETGSRVYITASTQRIRDPLSNIMMNTSAAISSSMLNVAVSRGVRDLRLMGDTMARPLTEDQAPDDTRGPQPNTLGIRVNGETKWYWVGDRMLVDSLIITNDIDMPFLGLQALPARLLRELITKDPGFMVANMLRDTMSSWVTSGVNVMPVVGTLRGYGEALMGTSSAIALGASGVVGGYDFKGDMDNAAKAFKKHQREGRRVRLRDAPSRLWRAWDKFAAVSETSTRVGVYNAVLLDTLNEAQAAVEAIEVINFSRKGANPAMRYMTAIIPFLNARIQGLDVLHRGMKGEVTTWNQQARRVNFYWRSATIVALSAGIYLAHSMSDEEENPWYHNAPEYIKDNYWIVPPTWVGMSRSAPAIRIPIPFEVGVLFKVIPERILRLINGSSDGRETWDAILRHGGTTLNFNPTPQWALPVLESVVNYSFYRDRPVVGFFEGKNESWVSADPTFTSPFAIMLSEAVDKAGGRLSAQKVDHVFRGYVGTLGSYALMAADAVGRVAAGLPEREARRLDEWPVLGRFLQENQGRGPVQTFYDLYHELDLFVGTLNTLRDAGDVEGEDYLVRSRANLDANAGYIKELKGQLDEMRKFRKQIKQDRSATPRQKREALDEIDRMSNEIVYGVRKLRTEALTRQ